MTFIVTLESFTPSPREDDEPWTHARIEESASRSGTFAEIDDIALSPVDPDPADPIARTFTVETATLAAGWYRVVWVDDEDHEQATVPVFNWSSRPAVADVAAILRARTRDEDGNELGEFTDDTRPTGGEVESYIDDAVAETFLRIPLDTLPATLQDYARRMVAIRAAMSVELSYNPDRTDEGSAYARLKELYDTGMARLLGAADIAGADDEPFGAFASIPIRSPTNPYFVDPVYP